jgi:hypothetical protein
MLILKYKNSTYKPDKQYVGYFIITLILNPFIPFWADFEVAVFVAAAYELIVNASGLIIDPQQIVINSVRE